MSDKKNNVILEEYENGFSYKKNKTNLNIEFNRIAFIFFVFLMTLNEEVELSRLLKLPKI